MMTKKVLYRVLALGWIPTLVLVGARGGATPHVAAQERTPIHRDADLHG